MRALRTLGGILLATLLGVGGVEGCTGEDPPISGPPVAGSPDAGGPTDGATQDIPTLAPDAAPPRGCPLGCLPPAPSGWTGPSAVFDGPPEQAPPTCQSPYTLEELVAHQGLTSPPLTCDCGPGQIQQECTVPVEYWKTSDCAGDPQTGLIRRDEKVPGTTCFRYPETNSNVKVFPAIYSGTCSYPSPTVTSAPPASFKKRNRACGLPQLAACTGRDDCTTAPVPETPSTRLCIHKAGEESCPSLDYSARFVAYANAPDGRSCTPCTGKPSQETCGSLVTTSQTMNCPTVQTTLALEECLHAGALLNLAGMGPTGASCLKTAGGESTGTVTESDPVTFCCNK